MRLEEVGAEHVDPTVEAANRLSSQFNPRDRWAFLLLDNATGQFRVYSNQSASGSRELLKAYLKVRRRPGNEVTDYEGRKCNEDNVLAGAALRCVDLGLPVFPLLPGRKEPLTANGFKDASSDPAQVEQWWLETPTAKHRRTDWPRNF